MTATTSAKPALPDEPKLLENKHFISVGSYRPTMQELPDSVIGWHAPWPSIRSMTARDRHWRKRSRRPKGELRLDEKITIESIRGSTMSVRAVETKFGPYDAIIPEVSGTASFTGRNDLYFDPSDPLGHGFIFR